MSESNRIERWCGDSDRTGVHAVAKLLKASVVDLYGLRGKPKLTQAPMPVDMIDEPSHSDVVDMLQALPREEAEYYSREENVVIQGASSESHFAGRH